MTTGRFLKATLDFNELAKRLFWVGFFSLVSGHALAHQNHKHQSVKVSSAQNPALALNKPYQAQNSVASDVVIASSYLFDETIEDTANAYTLSLNSGSESYVANGGGHALLLSGQQYLQTPTALSQDIQLDKSLSISVDFMLPEMGIDESVRVILSNKTWAYDVYGVKLTAFNEKTEWQPQGEFYVDFNIGVGVTEIASRFYNLKMGTWYNATIDLDFEAMTVGFGINGRVDKLLLNENITGNSIDPTSFINWMGSTPIRIGAHHSQQGDEPEWRNEYEIADGVLTTSNLADVQIDNLIIRSPKPDGDTNVIKAAYSAFAAHLAGTHSLTAEAMAEQLSLLRQNLNSVDFAEFATEADAFIKAHAQEHGALYRIQYKGNLDDVIYDNLPDISKAYVDLGVWMLEEGLTTANASAAEGIVLIEHNEFPGAVASDAARIQGGKANIRAQFVPEPGYLMGGIKSNPEGELSATLYRPTGFYAPAGELVRIKVDDTWVDSGVHIRVGVHQDNHMTKTSTSRFPLMSTQYRVEANEFTVVNPMGGGIYVVVPQGVDLGWAEIEISGAVRSPYFSTRAGHETAEADWQNIRNYPGPFADFESDKFMVSVPSYGIDDFKQPKLLLDRWDQIMDIFQVIHGRPLVRARSEAYLLDATQAVIGSFPGGYPVTPGYYAEEDGEITQGYYSPFAALNIGSWEQDRGMLIMLHELGHHHYGRFISVGEQESYVNVPAAAVLNSVYGLSYDEATQYSGYQLFTRLDAAIDWMVTHNFRNGNAIGFDPTTDYQPIETSYQTRGHAKYVDLADITGGWEGLGKVYEMFYLEDLASGNPPETQAGVSHDEFLLKGSEALECNLASLFHFWGIQPSASTAVELAEYDACDGALERVLHYLKNAPRTNEELQEFHQQKTSVHENQLKFQIYDNLLIEFDVEYGQQIRDMGTSLLETYFGLAADNPPSVPAISESSLVYNSTQVLEPHFSWSESVDPEGEALSYSWKLVNTDTDEVILYRNHVEGNSITLSQDEMTTLLNYSSDLANLNLKQQVTTSDIYTIVQSDLVSVQFTVTEEDSTGQSANEDNTGSNSSSSSGGGFIDFTTIWLLGLLILFKKAVAFRSQRPIVKA